MSTQVKNKQTLAEVFGDVSSGITGAFIFVILTIFPLYTHDMYFDILGARYVFFKVWAIMLVIIQLLLGILYLVIDSQNHASAPSAFSRFISFFKLSNLKKNLIVTDYFFFAMFLVTFISFLGSEFKEEAFYGNAGRYQGFECWIIYFFTYIVISRTFKFKMYYLNFALIAGCFACIWGTMDFLWMDPFGFFRNVSDWQKAMFASSIGNLNTYTNYTIMIFAIASTLFIIDDNIIHTIFYCICGLIGCVGCVCGLADNAVLGLFAFYLFVPFFTFKTRKQFFKYLCTIDFLFITLFFFYECIQHHQINGGQDSFLKQLVLDTPMRYSFIPFTIILIIVLIILLKLKPNYGNQLNNNLHVLDSILNKKIILIYKIVVILGFVLVIYAILDMNIFKQHVDFWQKIPSSNQLVFDDYWGTHRGHNWRIAFTNYFQNFNLFQKLFGYGPDTYLIISERTFYEEMVERFNEVYDSAHNEYINYLLCEGILGLISYLGTFISGIYYTIKSTKKNYLYLALAIPVICYMVQAFVNIAIPITTPVFFSLMYMGVANYLRERDKDKVAA